MCVKHYLDLNEEGIHPGVRSDTQGYTALDFAVWSAREGVAGAAEVAEYLRTVTPASPENSAQSWTRASRAAAESAAREAGLNTPLVDNVGAQMMARMGWQPGEPLGASSQSDSLREPLRPNTASIDAPRHGLGYGSRAEIVESVEQPGAAS